MTPRFSPASSMTRTSKAVMSPLIRGPSSFFGGGPPKLGLRGGRGCLLQNTDSDIGQAGIAGGMPNADLGSIHAVCPALVAPAGPPP